MSNAGEWLEDADDISDVSVEEEEVSSGEEDEGEDEDGSESSEDEWGGIEHSVDDGMDQHTPELSAEPDAGTSTGTLFSNFAKTLLLTWRIATTRYVPPHLRNAQQSKNQGSEVDTRLTKQLKGLLNRQALTGLTKCLGLLADCFRMSEQNLASILDGIEVIYRTYRRHGASSCSLFRRSFDGLCV